MPARAELQLNGGLDVVLHRGRERVPDLLAGRPLVVARLRGAGCHPEPDGWNSWKGPNRFDGHRPGDPTTWQYNEPALGRASWYVGLVVAKLVGVADRSCPTAFASEDFVDGVGPTVSALVHAPGLHVLEGPERVHAFGYPAFHVVAEETRAARSCESDVFLSSRNGGFGSEPWTGLWVVDVGGAPITVFAPHEGNPPRKYLDELASAVASIEFRTAAER